MTEREQENMDIYAEGWAKSIEWAKRWKQLAKVLKTKVDNKL